jgi:hypothetical protein
MGGEGLDLFALEEPFADARGVLRGLFDVGTCALADEPLLHGELEGAVKQRQLDAEGRIGRSLSAPCRDVAVEPSAQLGRLRAVPEVLAEMLEGVPHGGDGAVAAQLVVPLQELERSPSLSLSSCGTLSPRRTSARFRLMTFAARWRSVSPVEPRYRVPST